MSIQAFELGSNGRAGDFSARFWKKGRAFLESEQDGTHHPRGQPVGFSGNGVRFVNKSGNAAHAPSEDGRGGGEAAHAENNLWFELAVDGSTKRKACAESPDKTQNRRREWRRQSDCGQLFESETCASGKRECINFLFRDQQHDFVAAITQHLGHGDAGEKMSAGSTACDHCVHGNELQILELNPRCHPSRHHRPFLVQRFENPLAINIQE